MPTRVLINALNLFGAGARTGIGTSLIPEIARLLEDSRVLVLLPELPMYRSLSFPNNTSVIYFRRLTGFSNDIRRLQELFVTVPRLSRLFSADVCLTLGDLNPVSLPCPSVTLVHQALFLYSDREIAGLSSWPAYKRFPLKWLFARTIRLSSRIIVQTPVMAARLTETYKVLPERINVIPNPPAKIMLSAHLMNDQSHPEITKCEKPTKLLFLAAPYPHKNHAVLPEVANELRLRDLSNKVHIFVTLDDSIVNSIKIRKRLAPYRDVIDNLGHLPACEVVQALRASTALLIPTLVESYGNIYLEAMNYGLPILTSNRDFAHWICRDLAFYFEPLDAISIVDTIDIFRKSRIDAIQYRRRARERIKELPQSWGEVASQFVGILYLAAK